VAAGPLTPDAARIRSTAAWTQRAAMALESHTAMRSAGHEDPSMRGIDPEGEAAREWKSSPGLPVVISLLLVIYGMACSRCHVPSMCL
jgi:hypothetical protein